MSSCLSAFLLGEEMKNSELSALSPPLNNKLPSVVSLSLHTVEPGRGAQAAPTPVLQAQGAFIPFLPRTGHSSCAQESLEGTVWQLLKMPSSPNLSATLKK